jgi:hypothetical protein
MTQERQPRRSLVAAVGAVVCGQIKTGLVQDLAELSGSFTILPCASPPKNRGAGKTRPPVNYTINQTDLLFGSIEHLRRGPVRLRVNLERTRRA